MKPNKVALARASALRLKVFDLEELKAFAKQRGCRVSACAAIALEEQLEWLAGPFYTTMLGPCMGRNKRRLERP